MPEVSAPDPWDNLGPGTIDYVDMAMGRIIDTIRGAIESFPVLIKRIAELVAWLIGKAFEPIRDIEAFLRSLPAAVLVAVFALALLWLNGAGK